MSRDIVDGCLGTSHTCPGFGHLKDPHGLRMALRCWFVSPGPNRVHNVTNREASPAARLQRPRTGILEPERHHGSPARAAQPEQRMMSLIQARPRPVQLLPYTI